MMSHVRAGWRMVRVIDMVSAVPFRLRSIWFSRKFLPPESRDGLRARAEAVLTSAPVRG